jgi:antagonist of KipI
VSLEVLSGGLCSTVQDGGRHGWAALGVPAGGAADAHSLRLANLLVGNAELAAAIEITLAGPTLRFHRAARIALTGARIAAHCEQQALPGWRAIELPAGAELRLGGCADGARSYLAIDGGIAVEPVLGSRSTDLRGGFGGWQGRSLRSGDSLPLGRSRVACTRLRTGRRWINPLPDLELGRTAVLRLLAGSDPLEDPASLFAQQWQVTPRANRQGLRLRGDALAVVNTGDRLSAPVVPGTIQLPPDGLPIMLGVDAQTVGGYPRIGHVIRADWPRLAQLKPGDHLMFREVDADTAAHAWQAQRARHARIAIALASIPDTWTRA